MHCSLSGLMSIFCAVSVALAAICSSAVCVAGGGPENVLLVVNELSQDSRAVANHYMDLRKIPSVNVVYVSSPPLKGVATSEQFRKRIFDPLTKQIEARGLKDQIDYVVYSCDFPWQLNFMADFSGEKFPKHLGPIASLTGATYLSEFVKAKRKELMGLNANFYCAPPTDLIVFSRGFHANYRWGLGGRRTGQDGLPYMLSAILGENGPKGNTVDEIAWYLKRSAEADGTAPKGTIYFAKNKNIRSATRDRTYTAAVRFLGIAGVRAEIIEAIFPEHKQDVAGVTCGFNVVNPVASKSRILPGAIIDNLTSLGGQFSAKNQQTVVSEFLRMGAAGACGTVTEPTALPQKFPNNTLHVHYANGCSLAEAFYQSVAGPYQQLLVGDPLCQPWAKFPKVSLTGISDGATFRETVEIAPTAVLVAGTVASYQLFVDGVFNQKCSAGERFQLDTTRLADGYHEIRVVATDSTPIETQGRWIGSVMVKNGMDATQLTVDENSANGNSTMLNVRVSATNSAATKVFCNGVEVGEVAGGAGSLAIDKTRIGAGPVTLIAVAEGTPQVRSRPVRVVVASARLEPSVNER